MHGLQPLCAWALGSALHHDWHLHLGSFAGPIFDAVLSPGLHLFHVKSGGRSADRVARHDYGAACFWALHWLARAAAYRIFLGED
jgi:hypothetical protein